MNRRRSRSEAVGHWACALLVWIGFAAALQRAAPQASTFAQAMQRIGSGAAESR